MKTFTIELSDEQVAQLSAIHSTRQNRSLENILDQVVERGLYNLSYRTKYNRERYERDAEAREMFKEFKKELASKK